MGVNKWYFSLYNPNNLIATCGGETAQDSISGTGILESNNACTIRAESITLTSIRDEKSIPMRKLNDENDNNEAISGEPSISLDIHNIHHYALIYLLTAGMLAIMIFIKFRKFTFRLGNSISMPNLSPPENVDTT